MTSSPARRCSSTSCCEAKSSDLPVEQAGQFGLAINLMVARSLGLTLAPSLMLRADKVIE